MTGPLRGQPGQQSGQLSPFLLFPLFFKENIEGEGEEDYGCRKDEEAKNFSNIHYDPITPFGPLKK